MKQKELQKFALFGFAAYGVFCLYKQYQSQQAAAMAGIHMGALKMNPAHMGAVHMNGMHMGAVHMGGAHQMGMIR
jgi:hypothetical protein